MPSAVRPPTTAPTAASATPQPTPTVGPPALIDDALVVLPRNESPATRNESPPPSPSLAEKVFLKQNGQTYSVRDWATLERWIVERRVDETDLVSEGGIRWEPIGTRPDLAPLFGHVPEAHATPSPTFPFAGDTPFGAPTPIEVWNDEDTEGIPLGLPPLPTEETVHSSEDAPPERVVEAEEALPWSDPAEMAETVALAEPTVHLPEPVLDPATMSEPEPWELGLLEPDPDHVRPKGVGEDDVDTPYNELRYEPTEEVFLADDAEEGLEAVDSVDPFDDEPEVFVESEVETEMLLGPTPEPRTPRLEVTPSSHPAPETFSARSVSYSRETPAADGFTFDASTGPGPDRLPPISIPRTRLAERRSAAEISPAGPVPQLRRSLTSGATREAPTLEPLTEFPFEQEWEEEAVRKRPSRWLLGAALFVTFLALLAVAWVVGPMIGGSTLAPVPSEPATDAHGAAVPTRTEGAAHPDPKAPVPAPILAPAPEAVAPVAPRAPEAPVAPPAPVTKLIKRGWDLADADPPKAEKLFRRAVDLAPDDDEAAYGYGYVLLIQGRTSEATKYLCRARKAKRGDTRQDVNGMIETRGLKCP